MAEMPNTARGTGRVRIPRCIRARGPLLYGGEASGIDDLLGPTRSKGGHSTAASLTRDERDAIAAYRRSL